MTSNKIPLDTLLAIPTLTEFLHHIGGIYEKSPNFVTQFYNDNLNPQLLPPSTITATQSRITNIKILFDEIKTYVMQSSTEVQLELLRCHPDLCLKLEQLDQEKEAEEITNESRQEQGRAGLSTLTPTERTNFTKWNDEYKSKFNFPFILAVRNASKYTVLSALQGRLDNSTNGVTTYHEEIGCALYQVNKIAFMRLLEKVTYSTTSESESGGGRGGHGGFLTCHVLDTANGVPAAGMRIELYRYVEDDNNNNNNETSMKKQLIETFITNSDGRLPNGPALSGCNFTVGQYQWKFYVGDYFARFANSRISGTPFLDVVPLNFGLDDPTDHYHVPLLCSPWSYSTYRGS
jgi:2-oxo-4-hydroxy-4-carboxy-5-ureidoimidazoline decarboxylase